MTQWKELTAIEEWEQVLAQSGQSAFVLLKHSTTCPVSAAALDEFEQYLSGTPNGNVDYYLVKVIESRPVSNQIEQDLNLKHASPQIMYVKDRHVEWNTSHWSVTSKHMTAVLD